MTIKQLSLEAGPALDDLIATRIVGLKKARGIFTYWKARGVWEFYRPDAHEHYLQGPVDGLHFVYEDETGYIERTPPPYSTDIAWAFKVVDFMRKDGFSLKLFQPTCLENVPGESTVYPVSASFICARGPCDRHGTDFHNHHGAYNIEADTVPLAIVRAAIVARKVL